MPVISYFFGIYVRMYHDDHPPPHVPIEYQGHEALVDIETGLVFAGRLPRKAAALVCDWCAEHRQALRDDWLRATRLEPLTRIPGADHDEDRES